MSTLEETLQHEVTRALQEHLAAGEESTLLAAYELGRRALADGLGVLGVATLLNKALLEACLASPGGSPRMIGAAEQFILECLSPFEMAHRGVREANTALRGLNEVLEEQTRRISRELHDEAGQLLAAVYLALDEVGRELAPGAGERLRAVRELLDRIEGQLRRLSHDLRPMLLDDLGLGPALEWLADRVSARNGLSISVEGAPAERLPERVELALYRIAQEALTNAARHARASRVKISIWREGHTIRCSIKDDGIGFDAPTALARGGARGIGLIGMRERLTPLSGSLRISSAPGQGTEVLVIIPMNERSDGSGSLRARVSPAADPGRSPD